MISNSYAKEISPLMPVFKCCSFLTFHLHEKQHPIIKNILCQVVSHFRSRVQLKMFCCQLLMDREAKAAFVPVICVSKFLPCHCSAFNFQTPGLGTLITFLNIVSYFFNVVLIIREKTIRCILGFCCFILIKSHPFMNANFPVRSQRWHFLVSDWMFLL